MSIYTFIDEGKKFVVKCSVIEDTLDFSDVFGDEEVKNAQEARVMGIWNENTNTPILEYLKKTDDEDQKRQIDVNAIWIPNRSKIVLDNVFFNTDKREGHCTKTTAYLIKSLLLQAKKADNEITTTEVMLVSDDYCAASNCYIHAFMLNNFQVDKKDVVAFQKQITKLKEENIKRKTEEREEISCITQTFRFYSNKSTHKIEETNKQITKECQLNELENYEITTLSDPLDTREDTREDTGRKRRKLGFQLELKF